LQLFGAGRRLTDHNGLAGTITEDSRRDLSTSRTADAIAIDEEIAGSIGWISKLDISHVLASASMLSITSA